MGPAFFLRGGASGDPPCGPTWSHHTKLTLSAGLAVTVTSITLLFITCVFSSRLTAGARPTRSLFCLTPSVAPRAAKQSRTAADGAERLSHNRKGEAATDCGSSVRPPADRPSVCGRLRRVCCARDSDGAAPPPPYNDLCTWAFVSWLKYSPVRQIRSYGWEIFI